MKTIHIRLIVAYLLLSSALASAQRPDLYTTESILPNSKINSIHQDGKGFIWIGTEDGIARFNGSSFTAFHNKSAAAGASVSEITLAMLEDSRGTTWVGTSQGLQIFCQEFNSFTRFDLQDLDVPESNQYIHDIVEVQGIGGKGFILVSASQHGIYVIDLDSHSLDQQKRDKISLVPGSEFTSRIFLDSNGRIWLASEFGGLSVLDKESLSTEDIEWKGGRPGMSEDVMVNSFAEDDRTGDIIIGTSNYGILIFDSSDGSIRQASDSSARECNAMAIIKNSRWRRAGDRLFLVGTENNGIKIFDLDSESVRDASFFNIPFGTETWKIHCLLEDRQGNIWAGAYQTGLLLIPQSMFGFEHRSFSQSNIPGDNSACITSIVEDRTDKSMWVGTDGSGLFHTGADGKVACYTEQNSALPNNSVMDVIMDRRGTLWIATYLDGIVKYSKGTGFKPFEGNGKLGTSRIFCLLYDEDDDILYAGTHGNGMAVIQASTGKIVRTVNEDLNKWIDTMFKDKDGIIWLGTNNGPLCYNPENERLFTFDMKGGNFIGRVSAISQDSKGTIWIGTDDGLLSVKRSGEQISRYSVEDGLSSNKINGILEDNDNNLWVSTSKGMSRLNLGNGEIRRFYAHDGLQGNEFRTNAYFKNRNGRLFFGGTNGLTSFYPQTIGNQVHEIPQVYFTRLIVGEGESIYDADAENNYLDKYITDATRIVLPYSKNAFAIQYSVPEFTNPQRIRYAYRLDKFDKDWKNVNSAHDAIYTNLRHGRYTLTVKAYFDGMEDRYSSKSIDIKILPPPALSLWAIALYILLAAGLLALLADYAKNIKKQKREKEESDIKEMKIKMFTNLSHEIRTPLTLVMAPIRKLRESEQDPKKKDLYNLMYRNSLRILRTVNQVMDIQKIDNGQMSMHFSKTDIVYFIKDIMKSFDNMSVLRNVGFTMDSEQDSTVVWIDQGGFDKIIFNILSNAFKYTPEGGRVKIDVSGPKKNSGRLAEKIAEHVDITVSNTGNHIEDKDIDKIFERYYQSNVYDAKAGSGIGLNLARTLVEMHHGVVSASNTPDGVAFIISLPAGSEHLSKEELEASVQTADIYSKDIIIQNETDITSGEAGNDGLKVFKSKRNVVFVDDNEEMLKYLKMEMGDTFNIDIFDNVKDAWTAITASQPDAVVTDLIMSTETEGAEFCEKIKHNPGTNHIPVLILTSKTDEESVQKCTECGADRYLTKPISTKLLKSTIIQTITARDIMRNKYTKEVGYDFEEVKMSSSDDKLLSRVVESIKANIDNPDYGVEDLSRDVGMSRVHMNRKLKECISLSPSNLIKSIRLKQAAYLLANNKVNISEVAYRVGFSTHSYFSSSFHDYFGLTPKEFVARYSDSKDDESLKKLLEL